MEGLRSLCGVGVPRIQVASYWVAILGLVIWSLAAIFLPSRYPEWPLWLLWVTASLAGLLLLGSTVLHEFAHSLIARRAGIKMKDSWAFVDCARSGTGAETLTARCQLVAGIAGPATSIAMAPVLWLLSVSVGRLGEPLAVALLIASTVSLLIGFANLLPVFPLDGGSILHALLWLAIGDPERAGRMAATASRLLGILTALSGLLLLMVGAYLVAGWVMLLGVIVATARPRLGHGETEVAARGATVAEQPDGRQGL